MYILFVFTKLFVSVTELQPGGDFSLQFLCLLLFWFFYQSGKQWILSLSTVNKRNNLVKKVVKPYSWCYFATYYFDLYFMIITNTTTIQHMKTWARCRVEGVLRKKILYLIDQTRKTAYDYFNMYREESWKYDT